MRKNLVESICGNRHAEDALNIESNRSDLTWLNLELRDGTPLSDKHGLMQEARQVAKD